ncbi:DUF72 domain-containing protein [Aquabacterium sp. A7-Y]|uniref:DUF72 domain-containing protein n=1 Tax=Aquabacterium sp. A7-Y TaxID=1349605 RepID=UPI00223DD71F|nr:DUF72 domain-containing protein [Aquabacterium sp. A7-Y]MCW7538663.1 DUF72 domain-containing protein [Aquabacterium sp. A7-Y]
MGGLIYIGISGWRYEPWRGVFYPEGLAQRQELCWVSRRLQSIEINGSFYSLQRPEDYAEWYEDTPRGFVFSVKGPRYLTHVRRLKDIDVAIANFFASGLFELREKFGPLLWQFPPTMRFDPERFDTFLAGLPRDTGQAMAIAARREAFMHGRERLQVDHPRPLRHAVEVRHDSFLDPAFVAMLRRHRVALVVADTAGKWPWREDLCSDFVYIRLHGDQELYASGYGDAALQGWAERIRAWSAGSQPADARLISDQPPETLPARDVYCYFDNDAKVHAPFDAMRLRAMLGLPESPVEPGAPGYPALSRA